jgi:hypothetical protein
VDQAVFRRFSIGEGQNKKTAAAAAGRFVPVALAAFITRPQAIDSNRREAELMKAPAACQMFFWDPARRHPGLCP